MQCDNALCWTVRVDPARKSGLPKTLTTAALIACALVLCVLTLFSLSEQSQAGLLFALKFSGLLFCVTWVALMAGFCVSCLWRGKISLEYRLTPDEIALTERGRRVHARKFSTREVTDIRNTRDGVIVRTAKERMRVFCDAETAKKIWEWAHIK